MRKIEDRSRIGAVWRPQAMSQDVQGAERAEESTLAKL